MRATSRLLSTRPVRVFGIRRTRLRGLFRIRWTPPCRTSSFLWPRRSSKGWAQRRTRREKEAHKGGDNVGSLTHRLGKTRNKAAVGRAVMLEPFLRHIFSVFDNSRQISTSAVRDHSVWNPEIRSDERRGGKECTSPWSPHH